mmetsp:Transcript_22502/g.27779  ORF Transcript_22502/g.27779 Transcript_22502/m.27779 type:complete len:86 (+) Transcript_22502:215-472(+)
MNRSSSSGASNNRPSLVSPEKSIDSARAPMLSPNSGHKNYNRFKYYSALRTGFGHLGYEQPELEPPSHVIDQELFLFQLPFMAAP